MILFQTFYSLVVHVAPLQPGLQIHVLGAVQFPPFEHIGEQTAESRKVRWHQFTQSYDSSEKNRSNRWILYLRIVHLIPAQFDTIQLHVLGPVQVPPLEQTGEHIAGMKGKKLNCRRKTTDETWAVNRSHSYLYCIHLNLQLNLWWSISVLRPSHQLRLLSHLRVVHWEPFQPEAQLHMLKPIQVPLFWHGAEEQPARKTKEEILKIFPYVLLGSLFPEGGKTKMLVAWLNQSLYYLRPKWHAPIFDVLNQLRLWLVRTRLNWSKLKKSR